MFLHLTRSRAVVARKAHNLEVVCSIHTSATIEINPRKGFLFYKKLAKKFGELKKRRTFAPANETIGAHERRRNNTYIDIMLYSTKKI